ncbi:hypothetical protein GCM10007148_27500 [Parvularcula lutaonensis]|nr:hypothetical protein GCM10007148_27500 [Parvularcula lutaonensis]
MLSLGAAVIAAIVLHMVLTRQPPSVDDAVSQPEPPAPASVSYRSLGTPPGHRLPCDGPGATARGPRSTVPVAGVDSCRMIAPPERVTVEVLFDVTPQGLPANVMIEGSIPVSIP